MKTKVFACMLLVAAMALSACGSVSTGQQPKVVSENDSSSAGSAEETESDAGQKAVSQDQIGRILEPIRAYEIGTAGSSLKACIAVNDFMQAFQKSDISADDLQAGTAEYYSGLSDDEKAELLEQVTALTSSYPDYFTADGAGLLSDAGIDQLSFTQDEADAAFNALKQAIGAD